MDANCHVDPAQKVASAAEQQNLVTVNLTIWGMGCPNCAHRVRNGLLALQGVVNADVSHTTGSALVQFNSQMVSKPALLNAVVQAGKASHHEYSAMLL